MTRNLHVTTTRFLRCMQTNIFLPCHLRLWSKRRPVSYHFYSSLSSLPFQFVSQSRFFIFLFFFDHSLRAAVLHSRTCNHHLWYINLLACWSHVSPPLWQIIPLGFFSLIKNKIATQKYADGPISANKLDFTSMKYLLHLSLNLIFWFNVWTICKSKLTYWLKGLLQCKDRKF